LNEIGNLLRETRENAGVPLEEASSDLDIKPIILENIEDGNIGCFKDIFALKEDIANYAKYLGLDSKKIIDDFNDYLFEYTSKIPVTDIEKAIMEKKKEEKKDKVASPYTNSVNAKKKWLKVLYVVIGIIVLSIVIWSIKLITTNKAKTSQVTYVERSY